MRREPVQRMAGEPHLSGIIAQRAAEAVYERALAGPIGTDQPQALAVRHAQFDIRQRHESTEAFAQTGNRQQSITHCLNHPTMPRGAAMTKPTNSTPTSSNERAEEIVTVATCCSVPSSTAPMTGPSQVEVPPISGMAIVLTA